MTSLQALLLPGVLGLLLGLTLRWTGLPDPDELRRAFSLRIAHGTRTLLYALGASLAMAAALMWLAVIDVDGITVLPLSGGVLLGGAVFGVAAALAGFTPLTAFAGVFSRHGWEALATIAGGIAGAALLPLLRGPLLSRLQALPPLSATTLFATTLDEPFLLGGGFLGQACAGLLLMTLAAVLPSNRVLAAQQQKQQAIPPAVPAAPSVQVEKTALPAIPRPHARPGSIPRLTAPAPLLRLPAPAADPAALPREAIIAALPGEEPLVLDAADPPD